MKKLVGGIVLLVIVSCNGEAARIVEVKGNTQVSRAGASSWQPAAKGSVLSARDRVRCGAGARAELLLDNGHRVRLWPRSEVSLDSLGSVATALRLTAGKLRTWVKKLRAKERFEVKTPVAVCSVRGTDFSVEYTDDQQSIVEVYEGVVAAREEATGAEVVINQGEFTRILSRQAPSRPEALPEGEGKEEDRSEGETLKEEARDEIFNELSREAVMARAADEIKLSEYQNGKAMIDVSGNRVRLEEYILRTQPNEFKYVVLNNRENSFNFGKMIFTFNADLPEDLTLATKTMFTAGGPVRPSWWLTDVLTVMSNTVDQVNEEAHGGAMYADNSASPRSWTLGFANYVFSVNNKTWWQYTDTSGNGRIDSGEIAYYNIATGNPIVFSTDFQYDSTAKKYYLTDSSNGKIYFSEFAQPSGETAFHFDQKNNYSLTQWIGATDYVIDDNGRILTLADFQNKTSSELERRAYESNFERVYTSSVFNGRKIDLVFSAKLLIDAGMLNLPDPRTMQ